MRTFLTMLKTLLLLSAANVYISTLCSAVPRFQSPKDKIWQGNAEFSLNFLKYKINESPHRSFIASPFSVLLSLGQLALYANGTTHDQLSNVLNVDNTVEVRNGFRELLNYFELPKDVDLHLAQKIYTNVDVPLKKEFKSDTRQYFGAAAENVDFSENQDAAAKINEWVEMKTQGLISDLVDSSMLGALTQMVLVNAIHFKGDWKLPFEVESTRQKDFYLSPVNSVKVSMMYQQNIFQYTENTDLQLKALRLKYKDEAYSLLVLLPTSATDYSLKHIAQKITDPDVFNGIIDDLRVSTLGVSLPSLETSTTTDLYGVLNSVNVTEMFKPGTWDLSGILKEEQSIHVSVAMQKALVTIDESGTQAAAANNIIFQLAAPMFEPPSFNANRPYLYFILYEKNILFCGANNGN